MTSAKGERFVVAHGGRGGRGNSTSQRPRIRRPPSTNLAGPANRSGCALNSNCSPTWGWCFPNAGKSTLISRISAAKPKIADYPFTTLVPNLGVVLVGDKTFVVADIPGPIEGAHEGAGLGIQFLRHVERTKLLVHLVDVSDATGRDPVEDFDVIRHELASFSDEMARRSR